MRGGILSLVSAYIVEDDQWSVHASNGVVADARFNGGHAGINEVGRSHDDKETLRRSEAARAFE
jgi:hypothetical protein